MGKQKSDKLKKTRMTCCNQWIELREVLQIISAPNTKKMKYVNMANKSKNKNETWQETNYIQQKTQELHIISQLQKPNKKSKYGQHSRSKHKRQFYPKKQL